MTDKESLKARKIELEKELNSICKALNNFELNKKKEKYGDAMKCENCRYNAVLDFSGDGWHNCCGNEDTYACTCCHSYCEYFEPDNKITSFIKEKLKHSPLSYGGSIDKRDYEALKDFIGNIFTVNKEETIDKIITILKIRFDIKEDEIDV